MPRQPRCLIDWGYYHVLTRGNDRRQIFRADEDYQFFLRLILRYLQKYQLSVFHYCLMPNHVHLLIQAGKAEDLPKFMQGILQVYAQYFHGRYRSTGFLFQNRYKSLPIEKESYLLECGRYIERNPLRANLCRSLFKYPWSSFRFYAHGVRDAVINAANPIYLEMAESSHARQQRFRQYLMEERPYDEVLDKIFYINNIGDVPKRVIPRR